MKVEKAESSACRHVFRVEVDGAEFSEMRAHAFQHAAAAAVMPGFRKGHVPPQMLEARYGKEIENDAVEHAVEMAGRQILADGSLTPVTNPTVTGVTRSGEGLTFSVIVEVAPQVALGPYGGLELDREPPFVRPEEVDSVIDGIRRRLATWEAASRPARWGDMVSVDYDGVLDGKPLERKEQDTPIVVGGGAAPRELEERLVGTKPGDAFEVDATLPPAGEGKARSARLSVRVKEVKAGKAPSLDDGLAKLAGTSAKDLEGLRREVASRIRADRERESDRRLREDLVDRLLRFAPAEVAPSLVEEEMNLMAVRGLEGLRRQGVSSLSQLGLDTARYRGLYRNAAVRAVREAFVLEAVADAESIAVGDEDLEKEVRAGAEAPNKAEGDRLVATLKSDGRWERLRRRLRHDRALESVYGKASVTARALCP